MKRELVAKCGELFDVHPRDIMGHARFSFVTLPRFALYKALHMRGWTYGQIGRFMNRDHTTVMHGAARANYYMDNDEQYRQRVEELVAFRIKPIAEDDTLDAEER